MNIFDKERLISAPVASIPFGLYQLEKEDLDILKGYCAELYENPLKREVNKFTTSCYEHQYQSNAAIHNLLKTYLIPCVKELTNPPPKGWEWHIVNSWVEYRQKNEFRPASEVVGDFAFCCFVSIPYDIDKEKSHACNKNSINKALAKTSLTYVSPIGKIMSKDFSFGKNDEGVIMIYPSEVLIQSYPFFTADENTVVICGSLNCTEIPVSDI